MKHVARFVTALAVLGLAAPALPCDYMKTTQASAQPQPSQTASEKEKVVAKGEKGSKAQKSKETSTQKAPPTAAN